MIIRYLSDDKYEIKQVAEWVFYEWVHLTPNASLDRIVEIFSSRSHSENMPLTLVAIENQLLGTVSLVKTEMASHPEMSKLSPWLSSLYVSPGIRNSGIGEKLCDELLKKSRDLGHKELYLNTDKYEKFYTKRGWKTLRKENYGGKEVIVMKINLE